MSWSDIFAGVVTTLGVLLLFSVLSAAATGLAGLVVGTAIVGIVGVLLAFFGAGPVAGILAVRSGRIHGFLTWATSLLATVLLLLLLVRLTFGSAGAVGGVLGSSVNGFGAAVGPSLSHVDLSDVPPPSTL